MNPVYYIFLAVIVVSFVTGLVITIIDNINLKSDKKSSKSVVSTEINKPSLVVPVSNVQEQVFDNVVPYIPIQPSVPTVPTVQDSYYVQKPCYVPETPSNNICIPNIVAPTALSAPSIQPSVVSQAPSIIPAITNANTDHKIQISETNEPEYFSVPVLIPLSMDDDSL